MRFQTRNDVVMWAVQASYPANMPGIRRSYEEGSTEFLGGFTNIDEGRPGWIITFSDLYPFAAAYIIAVVVRPGNTCYLKQLLEVPWEFWDGEGRTNVLFTGDDPKEYVKWKRANQQTKS